MSQADQFANIRPHKILQLTFNYTAELSGGVGAHVQELSRGLKQHGCEVIVLTLSTGETAVVDDDGVQVHYVGATRRTLSQTAQSSIAQNVLAFNQDLIDYAQSLLAQDARKPDLIHYHHWFVFAAARQIGAAFNLPIVGTIQYLTHPIEYWWGEIPNPSVAQQENIWLQNARNLITISESMRELVKQFYPTVGEMDVIRHTVNLNDFWKTQLSPQAKSRLRATIAQSGQHIILFAGRINPMKGLEPLIDAAVLVREQYPDVRYVIAGAPDSRDYLSQIQARLRRHPGLTDNFTFLGRVPRQQLALLYQAADIAVFPSIYEPLGMVAVEAMASGVPPIVSGVGGLAEVVQHGRTGLHVPVHIDQASGRHLVDVEQLAAAQLSLLRDEALRLRLGRAGYDYMRNEHSLERAMLQPTLEVYRRIMYEHSALAEPAPVAEAQP